MEKTVTERSVETSVQRPVGPATTSLTKYIAVTIGVIVLIGAGFVGGMQFQKSVGGTAANATNGPGGSMSGFSQGMGQMGAFGTVTAVSSDSITINDERMGTTKTYSITSSTTVTDNGSTASVSDIKTGDTVMIRTSSSSSTEATSIRLNADMAGPSGQTQSTTSTSSSTTSSSTT